MLAAIASPLLMIFSLALLLIRLTRPAFAYTWLVSTVGALFAWALVFFARLQIGANVLLIIWEPRSLFILSPTLLLDTVSWTFAMLIVTLNLASHLASVLPGVDTQADGNQEAQPPLYSGRPRWSDLASRLFLTGVSVLAVMPGNLLTLLLAWAALDGSELLIWLTQERRAASNRAAIIRFGMRLAGGGVLLAAGLILYTAGLPLSFNTISPEFSPYLLLAAALRLGFLPLPRYQEKAGQMHFGLLALLGLAPASSSLMLAARTAAVGLSDQSAAWVLFLMAAAGLVTGLCWLRGSNARDGIAYWIVGMAALILASAVRAKPQASLAWSVALLLQGGLAFLLVLSKKWLLPIVLSGAFFLSALPLSPTWAGTRLYAAPFEPILAVYVVIHALFLAGFVRQAQRAGAAPPTAERWVWAIYPAGLAILLLAHLAIGLVNNFLFRNPPLNLAGWLAALAGVFSSLLAGALWGIDRWLGQKLARFQAPLAFFSLGWVYRLVASFFRLAQSIFRLFNQLWEGQAGILWSILILALLLSLLFQFQGGP